MTFSSALLLVVLILAVAALVFDQRTGQLTDIVMDTLKDRPDDAEPDQPAPAARSLARRSRGHRPPDPGAQPRRRRPTV